MTSFKPLENKNITVIGAARSGLGAALFLKAKGNEVFVSDFGKPADLDEARSVLEAKGIGVETGGHTDRVYHADCLVISPGVKSNAPVVHEAIKRHIPVISEIEAGYQFFPHPIIAITGTNGKTTTTALTGHLLTVAGHRPLVAGNIGIAFTATWEQWESVKKGVIEVSSFQLDHIADFSPATSMILNITPDHADRYQTFNHYARSKFRITENQGPDQLFIYNADNEVIAPYLNEVRAQKWPFSVKKPLHFGCWLEGDRIMMQTNGKPVDLLGTHDLLIPGIHNVANAMAAALAAAREGVEPGKIAEGLKTFKGVHHRIEFIRNWNGLSFYNDSKATNTDSVKVALDSFSTPIILIAGGQDPGNDYSDMIPLIKERVRAIVAIGESAEKVTRSFSGVVPVMQGGMEMESAIREAIKAGKPGDVVLLSPACKSFDMFKNYEHRGDVFRQLVQDLK